MAAQPELEDVVEEEVLIPELADTTFVQDASGSFTVSWPLLGMDCPDCASKAPWRSGPHEAVTQSNVSATSGEVKISINLEEGAMSEVSSVLRSLGHAPDVEHHEIVGVRAKAVARRNDVPFRKSNVSSAASRVLDAEISDDDRILVQLVVSNDKALLQARERPWRKCSVSKPRSPSPRPTAYDPTSGDSLAVASLPCSPRRDGGRILGLPRRVDSNSGRPRCRHWRRSNVQRGLCIAQKPADGFPVLTSLAVIGACILGMWEEALIVTILVAFTIHLEGDALVKAREAMQGGLDRLPEQHGRSTRPTPSPSLPPLALCSRGSKRAFSSPTAGGDS